MKNAGKTQDRVIVTVTDESLADIDAVAGKLSKKGLQVDQIMPMTGVITGSVATAKIPGLKNMPGVISVEKELTIQLPPSDNRLQ